MLTWTYLDNKLIGALLHFPHGSAVKESACNRGDARDMGSVPGWRRSPGEGNGNPHQYSCLKNPMDRGAWRTIIQQVTRSQTQLSTQVPGQENLSQNLLHMD